MTHDLNANTVDHAVAIAKGALGSVPIAGPFLAELLTTVVPRQRMDRMADYARKLSEDLRRLDEAALRQKLSDENCTDLLEEGMLDAVRAVSEERRSYIARLVSSSLTDEQVSLIESKHLLRILGQINDIEVIWLRYCDYPLLNGDDEFRAKHAAILEPVRATFGAGLDVIDKEALQLNYVERLVSLGLLRRPLKVDTKTKLPVFDPSSKEWRTEGRRTTPLGKLLLRKIGFAASDV